MLASSAISGIRASSTRFAVSAHNIANVNTEGFKASRAVLSEQTVGGGVRVHVEETAERTNLAVEMVEQTMALRYGQANGKIFRIQSDMLGELVNMWA